MKIRALTALSLTALSLAAVIVAAPALAQSRAKSPADITIANTRGANVTALSLTGEDGKVYGSLKKPLASGTSIKLRLARKAPCVLNVAATFDDESEGTEGQVDACTDKVLNLTD